MNDNLTEDQKKFINSWCMGGLLGMWYLTLNDVKKVGWDILIPYRLISDGRRIVWEGREWQDFETYRKKQVQLDLFGLSFIGIPLLIILTFILSIPLWR